MPLAICVTILLSTQIVFLIVPQFMRIAINSLQVTVNDPEIPANIFWPAMAILGTIGLQFLFYVPARIVLRRISISVSYDLRKRLFNHIQYQGAGFYSKFNTGDLMSRAVNDINMVRMVVSFGAVSIMTFIFQLSGGLGFMIWMSPELAIWVCAPLPIVAVIGFLMARGMYPYYRERQEAMASVTSFTQENLNGIRTIQAMSQEDQEIRRFRRTSTLYAQKYYRATRYQAVMGTVMQATTMLSPLLILAIGGSMVIDGSLGLGTYTAFTGYLMMVTGAVTHIGWSLSMFTGAAAGTERIYEVLNTETEISGYAPVNLDTKISGIESEIREPLVIEEPEIDEESFGQLRGQLEFRGFSYQFPDAARPAIVNLSLKVKPGETIAFLGRIGSGKTTILKSVVRLLETPPHSVFLDGHDICDIPIKMLREHVVLVPQSPFLFSASIAENVTYDDPSRPLEAVQRAVKGSGLEPAIEELEEGLDTIVGERGITLSGGQKQRATLARGLIRKATVLLLDDCFSSVDTETEERIINGLQANREGKTTILISHRVSTARHADRIFVLDNGKILESGTHQELLASGGYYADLESIQSSQEQERSRKSELLRHLTDDSWLSDDDIAMAKSGRGR